VILRLTCKYRFAPKRPTCNTSYVQTVFGIGFETGENVIAEGVEVEYQPGRIILFSGPSGSGKSSLLRAAAEQVPGARWLDESPTGDRALIDTLGDDVQAAAHLLSLCGLAEAFLMLRTPAELSDGQRYRYAIARCIASGADTGTPIARSRDWGSQTIVADEWCAKLDRITAKVVSHNARKIADRRGVGFLLATTHEDIIPDLDPDVIVWCRGGGVVEVERRGAPTAKNGDWGPRRPFRRPISFLHELELTEGSRKDWPYFARWHYRGHSLGFVHRVVLLWHGREPVGVCVVGPSALAGSARSAAFGLRGLSRRERAKLINGNFATVTRLVLDPRYRGAGIAARFLRRVAETTPWPWIELISEMANLVPFAEAAGFVRLGRGTDKFRRGGRADVLSGSRRGGWYGSASRGSETWRRFLRRVRFSRPAYYVFDNRQNCPGRERTVARARRGALP